MSNARKGLAMLAAVPIDPVLQEAVVAYGVRTLWAVLVGLVAIVLARAVRQAAMGALTRRRADASVTVLLGNLVLAFGALIVLEGEVHAA